MLPIFKNTLFSALTLSFFHSIASAELVAYWDFDAPFSEGVSIDERGGQAARILAGAAFTGNAAGRTGTGTDKAMRFGIENQRLEVLGNYFTEAFSGNEGTVTFWIRHNAFRNSTAVSFVSSSPAGARGFQAHTPWSNGQAYFDSGGTYDRINVGLGATAGTWHHIALVRKNDNGNVNKWIYRDGVELIGGINNASIALVYTQLFIGNAPSAAEAVNGDIDEFDTRRNRISFQRRPDRCGHPHLASDSRDGFRFRRTS